MWNSTFIDHIVSWSESGQSSSPVPLARRSTPAAPRCRLLNQAGAQGAAQGGHPECGKGIPDLPAPADEQADGERSNNTTESAQPHGPSNARGANGRGIQQGRQPDQARTRDAKKEAGEPQANKDECYGLTCVADCAERYGAANQSGRQNAASGVPNTLPKANRATATDDRPPSIPALWSKVGVQAPLVANIKKVRK